MWRRIVGRAKDYAQRVKYIRPPSERTLFSFDSQQELARWKTFSDAEYGGMSTAALALSPSGGHGVLRGELSTELTEAALATGGVRALRRSGFCGMHTQGEEELDLEAYNTLEFRVRGDGRKYIATMRTDNWISLPDAAHDLWQAFLFAPANEWADVQVPISRFVKTWRGKVLESEHEMDTSRILSFGISLAGGGVLEPPGPFQLELQHIRTRNTAMAGKKAFV